MLLLLLFFVAVTDAAAAGGGATCDVIVVVVVVAVAIIIWLVVIYHIFDDFGRVSKNCVKISMAIHNKYGKSTLQYLRHAFNQSFFNKFFFTSSLSRFGWRGGASFSEFFGIRLEYIHSNSTLNTHTNTLHTFTFETIFILFH